MQSAMVLPTPNLLVAQLSVMVLVKQFPMAVMLLPTDKLMLSLKVALQSPMVLLMLNQLVETPLLMVLLMLNQTVVQL
jgi:hypothetical protein